MPVQIVYFWYSCLALPSFRGVSGDMLQGFGLSLDKLRLMPVVSSLPGVTAWQPLEWYKNHSRPSRPIGEEVLLLDHCAEWHQRYNHSSHTAWLCAVRPLL
jgi:hypothetical protein